MATRRNTRKILVDKALEAFWSRSCGSVSVDNICRETGVNKGSFYYCFPSKTDIILAAVEEAWKRLDRDVLKVAFDPVYPPLHRIRRYFELVHTSQKAQYQLTGNVIGCIFCNLGGELSTEEPIVRERLEAVFKRQVGKIEEALKEAVADGSYSGDPHSAAVGLYNLLCGSLLEAKIRNDPDAIARTLTSVMNCLGMEGGIS